MIETLLLKASHSYELVARINHTNLICNSFPNQLARRYTPNYEETPCVLIQGIGDYLMRVVGSVPIGLRITLGTEGERLSYYDG
jgi:hypothetical protein